MSPAFYQALFSLCACWQVLGSEVSQIPDSKKSMLMLGCCPLSAFPHVLQARVELMKPFLLHRACLHEEATERNEFLYTLSSLIKRPDDKQSK